MGWATALAKNKKIIQNLSVSDDIKTNSHSHMPAPPKK
jgi:hypothetical protein